jgi:hypothetical protein
MVGEQPLPQRGCGRHRLRRRSGCGGSPLSLLPHCGSADDVRYCSAVAAATASRHRAPTRLTGRCARASGALPIVGPHALCSVELPGGAAARSHLATRNARHPNRLVSRPPAGASNRPPAIRAQGQVQVQLVVLRVSHGSFSVSPRADGQTQRHCSLEARPAAGGVGVTQRGGIRKPARRRAFVVEGWRVG